MIKRQRADRPINTELPSMRAAKYWIVCAVLSSITLVASVQAETPDETRTRVLKDTKFNLVAAETLSVPISQYQGDGDPETLEVVMFSNQSDGPSRVSDDGEVIFLYAKDSSEVQRRLIQKAFEIRIAKAMAAGGS